LDSFESIDYVLEYEEYVIFDETKSILVFILEVKPKQSLDCPSARDVADRHIRSRFNTLLNDYPFEEFYGVSAFDPKICIRQFHEILEASPQRLQSMLFILRNEYRFQFAFSGRSKLSRLINIFECNQRYNTTASRINTKTWRHPISSIRYLHNFYINFEVI
jgi:hypothetical protein